MPEIRDNHMGAHPVYRRAECEHKFEKFSIAFLGIRYQCILCDLIAPACFTPVESAKADKFFDDHIKIVTVP